MSTRIKSLGLILVLVLGAWVAVGAQAPDAKLQGQLKRLFPNAASFSAKQNDPPHYKALGPGNTPMGYAFWTTELTPLERGYDGPIKILVGVDTRGVLTGIVVAEHKEPYGDFSIDTPTFQSQFRNKDIRDQFRVGGDIDAISRATISVTTATRSIRNGARRIARALIAPPGNTE
jgi:NosR/NirI family nitrous oxide reductase transcriptional regulator